MNWLIKTSQARPGPPRENRCPSRACVDGYIRVPDFSIGTYVWSPCSDPIHEQPGKLQCRDCASTDVIVRNRQWKCPDCRATGSM